MKKFGKYIVGPIIVAILAFIMQALDQLICPYISFGSMAGDWIAFQAWAIYFLAGCDLKGGAKGLIAYVIGIVASIAIISLGGAFGGFWGTPLAVLIIVVPVICCEKGNYISMCPAIFVAAGAYFALMTHGGASFTQAALAEMIYCVWGLVWGWLTIVLRGMWNKKVGLD